MSDMKLTTRVTLTSAVAALGVTRKRLYTYLNSGVVGRKVDGRWVVCLRDLVSLSKLENHPLNRTKLRSFHVRGLQPVDGGEDQPEEERAVLPDSLRHAMLDLLRKHGEPLAVDAYDREVLSDAALLWMVHGRLIC